VAVRGKRFGEESERSKKKQGRNRRRQEGDPLWVTQYNLARRLPDLLARTSLAGACPEGPSVCSEGGRRAQTRNPHAGFLKEGAVEEGGRGNFFLKNFKERTIFTSRQKTGGAIREEENLYLLPPV